MAVVRRLETVQEKETLLNVLGMCSEGSLVSTNSLTQKTFGEASLYKIMPKGEFLFPIYYMNVALTEGKTNSTCAVPTALMSNLVMAIRWTQRTHLRRRDLVVAKIG
jgi:hypothetical protein